MAIRPNNNMFLDIFKKVPLWSPLLLEGSTDYHSHILPGVDDGVRELKVSLSILSSFEQMGVSDLWCTPHIMEDMPNTTEDLRRRFDELQAAYQGSVCLHLAAEYMMDTLFVTRLETNDLLPLGEAGDQLLVETSYFNPPSDFEKLLEEIQSKGYFPVLAHPERYTYMDEKDYKELKNKGIRFQLNLGSLVDVYGKTARKKAEWMLKMGFYDMHGSDIHSPRMLMPNAKISKRLNLILK